MSRPFLKYASHHTQNKIQAHFWGLPDPLSWPLGLTRLQPQQPPCCFSDTLSLFRWNVLTLGIQVTQFLAPFTLCLISTSQRPTLMVQMSPIPPLSSQFSYPVLFFFKALLSAWYNTVSITELFTVCLPHKDRDWLFDDCFQCLTQCLAHRRHSINICWMNVYRRPLVTLLPSWPTFYSAVAVATSFGAGKRPLG